MLVFVAYVTEYAERSVHAMIDQCFFPVIETLSLLPESFGKRERERKRKKRDQLPSSRALENGARIFIRCTC